MDNGSQESSSKKESNDNLYSPNNPKPKRNSRDFRLHTVKFTNFNNIYKKVNNQPIYSLTKLVNLSPRQSLYKTSNNLIKSNNLKFKLRRQDTLKTVSNNLFLSTSPRKQIITNEKEKENPITLKVIGTESDKNEDNNSLKKPIKRLKSSSTLFNLADKKLRYSTRPNIQENNFRGRVSRRKLATVRPIFSYQLTDQKNINLKTSINSNNLINQKIKLKLSNSNTNQYKEKKSSINISEENLNNNNNSNKNGSKQSFSFFNNISNGEKNKRQSLVNKKNQITYNINPFSVPEEDKIFDEMKSYLCFKYDSDENNNNQKNNSPSNENKNITITNSNQNNAKTILKNKKRKKILSADDKKLESLYSFSYSVNRKIKIARRTKYTKELEEYQECLLENIKPILSFFSYMDLKRRFEQIREKVQKKYQNNLENIKDIEYDEENIINHINYICRQCLKNFSEIRANKTLLHSANLKIKLPMIKFVTCIKSHKKLKNKNKSDKSKKRMSVSKNKMGRNSNIFNKTAKNDNKNKEVFDTEVYSLTNYNKRKSTDSFQSIITKNKGNDNKRNSIKSIKIIKH